MSDMPRGYERAQAQYDAQTPPEYEYQGYECRICGDWTETADPPENEVCDWCQHRIEDDEQEDA